MRYIKEFRNKSLIKQAARQIRTIAPKHKISIMEVCGTHTQSFCRFALSKLLPAQLKFISGPGCPVCVSSQQYIDASVALARNKDVIILTFGDMLRVPGSLSTLENERARFGNVRVVYSASDSLKAAKLNPDKRIIFLGVGFETTAPTIALAIMLAKKENLTNLFFFTSLKLIPAAMDYLLRDRRLGLEGFLCPGHVSAIIGTRAYEFIPQKYGLPCCIAGFEPLDIMQGILLILRQIREKIPRVENQYARVVTKNGNLKAQRIMSSVFKVTGAYWRGLGEIPASGLALKEEFLRYDAEKNFKINLHPEPASPQLSKCRCGDILKGLISPEECRLFSKACSPDNPIGPCMVASEGACNAYYKYR